MPPGVRGAPGNNRDGAAAGQAKRGYKIPLLPRMKMNFRSGKGGILPQFMRGGGETIGNRRRQKTPAQLAAHFLGMVFLIVIHAGLIIWASTLAISFLYRVDLSSESVKVNEALEVFGEQNMDWLDADGGAARQAHIRIGSRTNADGSTRADEVLEFGTYRGDIFVPKSLLRSEGDGTLEVVTNGNKLALAPNGGNVGVGTNSPTATLDVDGEAVVRGNASFGGNDQPSLVKIDSQGTQTVGLQLGPGPMLDAGSDVNGRRRLLDGNASSTSATSSDYNKKSFGVYSLVGGEQVVMKRGNDTVMRFDEHEDTEVAAPNNVVIRAHEGDVNLISLNGKIRIHGAIELGGSDLSGSISDTMDSTGSAGLLSALSVVNGTVKIAAPRVAHEGRTDFNGTFTTGNGDIQLGWSWEDTIDVRGRIMGQTALTFGGAVDDENKISLVVDEPTSAWRTIRLPDASGRVVVSAQVPLTVSETGEMILNQSQITTVGALEQGSILDSFGDINIGKSALMTQELTVHGSARFEGPVLGEVPLFFGRNSTLADDGFVTAFNLRAPSWNNTIYIPDSNGTFVITVSNPHGFQRNVRGHLEFNYTTFNKTGWLNAGRIIPGFGDINIADESVSANSYRIQSYANSLTLGTVDAMFNTTNVTEPKGYGIRIRSVNGDNSSNVLEEAQGRYIHLIAGNASQDDVSGGLIQIEGGASTGQNSTGGDVIISGGNGASTDAAGGSIQITWRWQKSNKWDDCLEDW